MTQSTDRGEQSFSALVLAGRRGPEDGLAKAHGVSHRALLPVAGVPMLLRVVRALRATPGVSQLRVSIDSPELLESVPELAALRDDGGLAVSPSAETPSRSVADALEVWPGGPVLVTTADHALLTPDRIGRFLRAAEATNADAAVALVERGVLEARYPESRRTWLKLRGGSYTGANLFLLVRSAALRAVDFFTRAETHRKTPWRLAAALGPELLFAYARGSLRLEDAFSQLSRRTGVALAGVALEDAEAAIDVDREADLALAERILAERAL